MIKPETLYNFGKMCSDPVVAGHVLMALCKQDIELTPMEQVIVNMVKQDSEWMDERIEANKAKMRERQKAHRAKTTNVTPVTQCHGDICDKEDVTDCHGDICDKCDVTPVTHHPLHPPQPSHPTQPINPNIKHRPDPDKINEPVKGVVGGRPPLPPASVSGSARYKFGEIFGWDDERVFSCDYGKSNVLEMYLCTFGEGMWAAANRELGDMAMLEALAAMCHEVRAHDSPRNPAAAMTTRLQKLLAPKGDK